MEEFLKSLKLHSFTELVVRLKLILIESYNLEKSSSQEGEYEAIIEILEANYKLKPVLPPFIKICRTIDEFRRYIKSEQHSNEQRTQFINKSLTSLEIEANGADFKLRTAKVKKQKNAIVIPQAEVKNTNHYLANPKKCKKCKELFSAKNTRNVNGNFLHYTEKNSIAKQFGSLTSKRICFNCFFDIATRNVEHAENWKFNISHVLPPLILILPFVLVQLCYNVICLPWIDNLISFANEVNVLIDLYTISCIIIAALYLLLLPFTPKILLWFAKQDLLKATKAKFNQSATLA